MMGITKRADFVFLTPRWTRAAGSGSVLASSKRPAMTAESIRVKSPDCAQTEADVQLLVVKFLDDQLEMGRKRLVATGNLAVPLTVVDLPQVGQGGGGRRGITRGVNKRPYNEANSFRSTVSLTISQRSKWHTFRSSFASLCLKATMFWG